jgi:hypothetical protein
MSWQADASAGVRRARERFLSEGRLGEDTLRTDVLDSWRRSRALGVHPDRMNLPFVQEPNADSPLTTAAAPVRASVSGFAGEEVLRPLGCAFPVFGKGGAGEPLEHHAGQQQQRAARPVVHHEALGLPGGVEGDQDYGSVAVEGSLPALL